MSKKVNYWLMKSEPDVYSIDKLKSEKTSLWDGVRNYQARNFMMNDMKKGDIVLYYHSNAKPSGIIGLATISKEAVVDPTSLDPKSEYFDPKSTAEKPRWFCVEVKYKKKFKEIISLQQIKDDKKLKDMVLVNNMRLSVQPVLKKEFDHICKLAGL